MIPSSLQIGPLTVHFYGLIIAIAIYIGWFIAKKRAKLYKIPEKLFDDPILVSPLLFGIIGGRLYHVASSWQYYQVNISQIVQIWNGGLGILGALIGIFGGFYFIARKRKIKFLSLLDLISPSLIFGQALGRIGNYINQEAFGPPTNLPWGVFIDRIHRPPEFQQFSHFHPTFFYEAALDLIFFVVLLYLTKKLKVPGQLFAAYLILYALGRFFVEFFRIDTWVIDQIRVAHILSVATLLLGAYLFIKLKIDHTKPQDH